ASLRLAYFAAARTIGVSAFIAWMSFPLAGDDGVAPTVRPASGGRITRRGCHESLCAIARACAADRAVRPHTAASLGAGDAHERCSGHDHRVKLRVGIILWILSWVPYGLIFGLSDAW